MSDHEELRGSAPILTAKDVLLELRNDVKDMKSVVDVLAEQELNTRLNRVEAFQNRLIGISGAAAILGLIATTLAIINALRISPL